MFVTVDKRQRFKYQSNNFYQTWTFV